MTTTEHILRMFMRPERAKDVARAVVIGWEISPCAVRRASLPAIAAMNGQAEKISRAVLEWTIEGDSASARLKLEIGEDDVAIPLVVDAAVERVVDAGGVGDAGGLEHLIVDDRLVICRREGDGRLLYARTALLNGALGLPGGVFDGPLVG